MERDYRKELIALTERQRNAFNNPLVTEAERTAIHNDIEKLLNERKRADNDRAKTITN